MTRLLLLFLAVGACNLGNAQYRNDTKYGMRLGLNVSNLNTDYFQDADSRIAPAVIFFAEIPVSTKLSIVPELGFSALGVKEDRIETMEGNSLDFKTNWLTVGILGQYDINEDFYATAGPQVAFDISSDNEEDYYNTDILAVIGVGYRLSKSFTVDARYGYGFTNIFEGSLETQGFEANNRFLQLSLSYRL